MKQPDGLGDIRISISSRNNWLEARMEAPSLGSDRGSHGNAARLENWSGTKREDLLAWISNVVNQLPLFAAAASVQPALASPSATAENGAEFAKSIVINDAQIDTPAEALDMEFVDLSLEEAENSADGSGRVIEASGRLRVYSDATDSGGVQPSFIVEFLLVNLDTGVTETAALEQGDIQPGEWAREIRRAFAIPGKGRYQVRAVVKNAPSGQVVAESSGPTLRVID